MHRNRLIAGLILFCCALALPFFLINAALAGDIGTPKAEYPIGYDPSYRRPPVGQASRQPLATAGNACGAPGAGSCFQGHAQQQPFCDDLECCQAVCAFDPFCCGAQNGTWDQFCAGEALQVCDCQAADAPANNNCANAQVIGLGDTPIDNNCATPDGPSHAACGDGYLTGLGLDVWLRYTPTFSGPLQLSTCGQMSQNWDTQLAFYSGCNCAALTDPPLACNDGVIGCPDGSSFISVSVTQGVCYTIRVGSSYLGIAGTGTLTLDACPADIDGNMTVNASDLAVLLGAWGDNLGHPADLNHDGTINATDLAQVLGSWGSC